MWGFSITLSPGSPSSYFFPFALCLLPLLPLAFIRRYEKGDSRKKKEWGSGILHTNSPLERGGCEAAGVCLLRVSSRLIKLLPGSGRIRGQGNGGNSFSFFPMKKNRKERAIRFSGSLFACSLQIAESLFIS
jgi:hypothetical protein